MLIFKLRLLSHALNARTSSIEKINVVLKRYRTDYLVFLHFKERYILIMLYLLVHVSAKTLTNGRLLLARTNSPPSEMPTQ
jgi:hypothetical protein